MGFTVFLALCILGCDVLIFFLFQWTLGERRRTRRRRNSKMRLASGLESDLIHISVQHDNRASSQKVLPCPKHPRRVRASALRHPARLSPAMELSAHRRRVAAFSSIGTVPTA